MIVKVTANEIEIKVQSGNKSLCLDILNSEPISVEVQALIKGEKGDAGVGFIPINGGYTLPAQAVDGQRLIIMVQTRINSVQLVMHPGPNPVGPLHVFGPNTPDTVWIEVIYAFGQWFKIGSGLGR